MNEIVKLKNINKTFYSQNNRLFSLKRNKLEVLRNFNLTLRKGEVTALLGPNGSGKTTIFKMISTLLLPNAGTLTVNEFDPSRDPIPVRKLVSLVTSEERSFYFRLTGMQNLLFFATLCNLKKSEAKKRIANIDSILKIEKHLDIRYQEFSTGLKQKLNLARGLMRDFRVLLLDEPVKSVDPVTSQTVLKHIKDNLVKNTGISVLMTTHNLKEIENFADRFLVINKCSLVADFRRDEFKNSSLESVYNKYVA